MQGHWGGSLDSAGIMEKTPLQAGEYQNTTRSNRMGVSAEGGKDLAEEQVFACSGKRVN